MLKKMVRKGEGIDLEFKRKINHPEKVVREVVAFANTHGGHLLVGVSDSGEIPGLKFAEEEEFIMTKAIDELCKPKIQFEVESIQLSNKKVVLHYTIPPSTSKPHFAFLKKNHRYGKAYVRVEDRSIQASKEIRKLLKTERNKTDYGFSYGNAEKALMQYLGQKDHTTLKEFCDVASISKEQASQVVIGLAHNHVIKIVPREKEDWYVSIE